MTAVLRWGSASRRGLGSLTSNTRLVDRSETPRTATNLCESEICRGPDFISVAEALFRPSVTWRRGAARSLGTLATPTPTVSTWLEILSWLPYVQARRINDGELGFQHDRVLELG